MVSKRKPHAHSGSSCPHLDGLTQQKRKKLLDAIWANATQGAGDSAPVPGCPPTAGLQCVACGRLSADAADHRGSHPAKRLPAGHELALDLATNEVYCLLCADYVYCPDVDRAVTALLAARRPAPAAADPADPPAAGPMIRDPCAAAPAHVDLPVDAGAKAEEGAGGQGSDGSGSTAAPPAFRALPPADAFPPGLRGLNNMGHTCFMNSILQALIHAPVLPEHHLAQGHPRGACPLAAEGDACVACELDAVFSEAYSGERAPHSPAAFLHAWWALAGGDLGGGCKQQDAHEFFLFVLEMLVGVTGREGVIGRLFEGALRSDVVCGGCGAASTTSDHFTHLSLDIPPPGRLLPPPIVPRPSAAAAAGGRAAAAAAAAAAKGGRQLVGAAKAAHLARLNRQQAGRGAGEPTPEPSSQAFGDATATLTLEESAASEAAGTEALGATATSGSFPRPSPPPGFHNARMAEPQAEQASGIDAGGAAVAGAAAAADTLSSPQRRGEEEPPRDSTSPSATDVATNPTAPSAAAAAAPGGGPAAAAAAAGQLAHPALAGYLHWPGASLVGCLRRFVWPERLGAGRGWRCPGCGGGGAAVKQLTLARLPPILVMHAKRFEHSGGPRAAAKKLDTYLSFPLQGLDMAPFLTAAALRARQGGRPVASQTDQGTAGKARAGSGIKSPARSAAATVRRTRSLAAAAETKERSAAGARSTAMARSASAAAAVGRGADSAAARDGDASAAPSAAAASAAAADPSAPSPSALYDLFAVVCHRGTFQGGHYVAYVRSAGDGRWYLCDDAYVAPVAEETVRTSQAYMLFYGQRELLPWGGERGGGGA